MRAGVWYRFPMKSRAAPSWLYGCLCVALGCGPGSEGGEGDSGSADGSGSGGDTGAAESDGGTAAQGSSSTGESLVPIPARGIRVGWVEANQGIGVDIGLDGEWVGPNDRTSPLLQGRIALVRAFWELDPDFEPREIEAQLHLSYPDGTIEVLEDTKLVEGESFIGDLGKSFYWGIEAEKAVPGLKYKVELYEVEPGPASQADVPSPHLPRDGSSVLVGIEESDQALEVVLVPVQYDDGQGCATEPDMSEETMALFHDYMFMMNPVDRLELTIHEPLVWDGPLASFNDLNSELSLLRNEEGAGPQVFYYGYVDVCDGGLNGAGGQAYGIPDIPPVEEQAYRRVSSGLSLCNAPGGCNAEWQAETFVHEVGHSMGRRHVACNGEEGGPDPSYPIEGGDVGEWGFGVIDFQLRHPTVHKDFMTYCHPVWVSSWGWNKAVGVIEALTSWSSSAGARADDARRVLVGTIDADGRQRWHVSPGAVASAKLDPRAGYALELDGRRIAVDGAEIQELPDGGGTMVVIPLPAKARDARELKVVGPTQTFAVKRR